MPQTRFIHGSKQYEPQSDRSQVPREQSDLVPYCLLHVPKSISRQDQTEKVLNGGKRGNFQMAPKCNEKLDKFVVQKYPC